MPENTSLAQAVSLAFGRDPDTMRAPQYRSKIPAITNYLPPCQNPGGYHLSPSEQPLQPGLRPLPQSQYSSPQRGFHSEARRGSGLPEFQDGNGGMEYRGQISSRASFEHGVNQAGLDPSDTIKVAVRVRPLLDNEKTENVMETIQMDPEDPTALKVMLKGPLGTNFCRDFHFHACLGQGVSQEDVFERCSIYQLLNAALAGYNVTIMAYGQTGSGKTYTMSGKDFTAEEADCGNIDPVDPGIVIGSIEYLVGVIPTLQGVQCNLKASYLEIYNEAVYDMMANSNKSLPVKWDSAKGFHVPGLKVIECSTFESVKNMVAKGLRNRRVGSHDLNSESSRGHTILTIYCESIHQNPGTPEFGSTKCGKVSFVDLAGSERLKDSRSTGDVLKETANINKSLFNLGKVISALAERDSSPGSITHVPYRDSTLTKLLVDSLGGSAFALMIACCSPAPTHIEETLSTLMYATRAKGIINCPVVQYNPGDVELVALKSEVEYLREENYSLRDVLRRKGSLEKRPQIESPSLESDPRGSQEALGNISIPWVPTPMISTEVPHENIPKSATGNMSGMRRGLFRSGSAPTRKPSAFRGLKHQHSLPANPSSWMEYGSHTRDSFGEQSKSDELHPDFDSRGQFRMRLMDTQDILARFSEENGRLAQDNERLRSTGEQMLSSNHILYGEINKLKMKLTQLECAILSGDNGSRRSSEVNQATVKNKLVSSNTVEAYATPRLEGSPVTGGREPENQNACPVEDVSTSIHENDNTREAQCEDIRDGKSPLWKSSLQVSTSEQSESADLPTVGQNGRKGGKIKTKDICQGTIIADTEQLGLLFDTPQKRPLAPQEVRTPKAGSIGRCSSRASNLTSHQTIGVNDPQLGCIPSHNMAIPGYHHSLLKFDSGKLLESSRASNTGYHGTPDAQATLSNYFGLPEDSLYYEQVKYSAGNTAGGNSYHQGVYTPGYAAQYENSSQMFQSASRCTSYQSRRL